jgi:hypothetical protein
MMRYLNAAKTIINIPHGNYLLPLYSLQNGVCEDQEKQPLKNTGEWKCTYYHAQQELLSCILIAHWWLGDTANQSCSIRSLSTRMNENVPITMPNKSF